MHKVHPAKSIKPKDNDQLFIVFSFEMSMNSAATRILINFVDAFIAHDDYKHQYRPLMFFVSWNKKNNLTDVKDDFEPCN